MPFTGPSIGSDPRGCSWRQRQDRFLRRQCGSATVQHAIFIALIIGMALLAIDRLGLAAKQAFTNASAQMADGAAAASPQGGGSRLDDEASAAAEPAASTSMFYFRLIAFAMACSLGGLCWYWLVRPRGGKQVEEEELPLVPQTNSEIERDLIFDKRHNLLRLFHGDPGMLMNSRVTVRHVMSDKVYTVLPNTPIDEIREAIEKKKFRHVLVCDKAGHLAGLITNRNLERPLGQTAAEIMHPEPITVEPDALLNPTITQLVKQRLYCLPVVERGKLVGVITTTDILMAMQCTLHALQRTASEVAADLPPGTVPGFMLTAGQFVDMAADDDAEAALSN